MDPDDVRELLAASPGITVLDDPAELDYPMAIDCAEEDDVYVGRIRRDESLEGGNGLNMWVVSDNLRKGAALNAVQIAELLIRDYL